MSTVAFDGRFFVADTQITGVGMTHGFSKMKVLKDRYGKVQYVFMFTGDAFAFEPAIKAFLALPSELGPNAFDDSPSCLYVFNVQSNRAYIGTPNHAGFKFLEWLPEKQYTDGSGGSYAIGALLAGKDAKAAVLIASQLDPYTNDQIQHYDLQNPNDLSHLTKESIIDFDAFTACDHRFIDSSSYRVGYLKRARRNKEREESKLAKSSNPPQVPPGIQLIELPGQQNTTKSIVNRQKNNRSRKVKK